MTEYEQYTDQQLQNIIENARSGIKSAQENIDWAEKTGRGWDKSEFYNMWQTSKNNWHRRMVLAQAEIKRRAEVLHEQTK